MQSFEDRLLMQGYQSLRFADDQDVVMRIRYIGAQASGTIQVVTASHYIEFLHGAVGAEAADTTIKLPTGGTAGRILVSDASADTLAEVVDHINASANWQAVLVGALRADACRTSTVTNFLNQTAAVQAKTDNGATVLWDTSTFLSLSVGIRPEGIAQNMISFPNELLKQDRPIKDWKIELAGCVSKATYTGAGTIKIYEDQTLKMQWDPAASTAEQFKNSQEVFYSSNGKPLLLRFGAATTFATAYLGTWFRMVQM